MVTFVLIPFAKKAHLPTDNFYILVPLLMHNANILFMAIELVVNRVPFAAWHFPFILLYGTSYAVFSWVWNHYNGYYFYFFLDYTRPGAIFWYIALMVIVAIFFLLGYSSSMLMNSTESLLPSLVSSSFYCIFPIPTWHDRLIQHVLMHLTRFISMLQLVLGVTVLVTKFHD